MKSITHSIMDVEFGGVLIDVECHISRGLPAIIIVGFVSKAVDEAKERIRSAFAASSIDLPKKRITINIAPADLPKNSTGLDLAIASSILIESNIIPSYKKQSILIGELGLNGDVRAVRGIIGKILAAKNNHGINIFYIPKDNLQQARLIPEVTLYPVKSLKDLYLHQTNTQTIKPINTTLVNLPTAPQTLADDFSDITGQPTAKRALEIAAAGGHNILLNGPPGTGKSMLAKATLSILPPLAQSEALEITHIHSLSSHNFDKLQTNRPFRAPHHSASNTAIVGGGNHPRPGEISLSHRGILFLDELPEFSRVSLEALRQPLEDRVITVSRIKGTITYPANFMLVATSNPCPCGFYGTHRACTCSAQEIQRYQRKLSGPIMDRIDIFTEVNNVEHNKLLINDAYSESSKKIATRVHQARQKQNERYNSYSKINSDMTSKEIKNFAFLTDNAKSLLNRAAKQLDLSPRSYMRTIKVARTIADLGQSNTIQSSHISEAIQFRPKKIINL